MNMAHGNCTKSKIAHILVAAGGLNWGLVGIGDLMGSNWNIVNLVLGGIPYIEPLLYILIGLATIGTLTGCRWCKSCRVEKV